MLLRWQETQVVKSKPTLESIRQLFQFLARHYPQANIWKR